MQCESLDSGAFRPYGRVLEGYDLSGFLPKLAATPLPEAGTVYVPGDPALESDPLYGRLEDGFYGGMPVQIGYCNGVNSRLNCLEYHRDSEVNIAADDMILLVALRSDIVDGWVDTARVRAFRVPAGTAVELFATTLHYAPCGAGRDRPFRVAVVLPKGTNTAKPDLVPRNREDTWLAARNKWLLAHPEAPEAADGAAVGLKGDNIDLEVCMWSAV